MTAFEIMQKHYRERTLAARQWKSQSGKVAGYFCDNVPEELILAAGFFPMRLSGNPCGTIDIAQKTFIPRARNREDWVHSILNDLLTGYYDFLDYLIIPHSRETIRRLYLVLLQAKETNPALQIPELYYLDALHTTFFSSGLYNRDRLLGLKNKLEEWSGKKITDTALSHSIAVTNESKRLLKKLAAFRAADPPQISGVQALQIIGSSMFMLKEEHNQLLNKFLEEKPAAASQGKTRLFVVGSPLDNLQLYEIMESSNAVVIAEDNCWGNRYSDVSIDTTITPFDAIADRYHNKSPCNHIFPMTRRIQYALEKAREAKSQGAVFFVYNRDTAESWETPDKIKAFESENIPVVYLKKQPYHISDSSQIKSSVEELIRTINNKTIPINS